MSKRLQKKVQTIVQYSKNVLITHCLQNGAIVAGNSSDPHYSNHTPNYMFSWPRDSAFIVYAMDMLGLSTKSEQYFVWCLEKASDANGMLWQHYAPNGLAEGFFIGELYSEKRYNKIKRYVHPHANYAQSKTMRSQLQPDGNGLLLWALHNHLRVNPKAKKRLAPLAERLANGLVHIWNKDTYKYLVFGPWEEKLGYPGVNLTYTIATSINGLDIAIRRYGARPSWVRTKNQMRKSLDSALQQKRVSAVYGRRYDRSEYKKLYSSKFGKKGFNPEIDASLFGLFWPTNQFKGAIALDALTEMTDVLERRGGIIRYPGDAYDGIFVDGSSFRTGGNAWPLLNLWASICFDVLGNTEKAEEYFNWVLERIELDIPEQITTTNKHQGPYQLAWAHAMFVIAAQRLGYI